MVLHLFQKACGAMHSGVVTIRIGFFIWTRMDKRRLQSVLLSGMNDISHVYAISQPLELVLVVRRIVV